MATGPQTVTTAAVHIDEIFEDGAIRALEHAQIIGAKADSSWVFKGHGDTHRKSRIPNIEAQTKAADTALSPTVYTDTEQTVSINVHQACAIKHENIAQVLSRLDVKAEMTKKMGYSLGRAVETNLAALAQNFSQIVGTLGSDISYDDLLDMVVFFETAGYALGDNICAIISPQMRASVMKLDQFIHADYRGEANAKSASENGMIGTWQKMPFYVSNLTRSPATGQHESFAFHKETIALIMAENQKTTTETIALDQADIVVKANIYGYAEINRYSETPGNITATDEGAVLIRGK